MKIGRRRAAMGTFFGASANMIAASLQAILLTRLVLRSVGPDLYGAWLASGEVLIWMLAFDFGIPNLLIQRVGAAHAKDDLEACGQAFAAGITMLAAWTAVLVVILCGISPFVPGWLHIGGSQAVTLRNCFMIASITTCTMLVDYGFHALARGLQDTKLIYRFALAGTLLGFVLTAELLHLGFGLFSVALGLIVRVGVAFFGSIVWFLRIDPRIRRACKIHRDQVHALMTTSPPMFISGIAYAVMNNSGVTLSAILLGPQVASTYGISKRAADLARSFSDMVGFASYGGFSHLQGSEEPEKIRSVYSEIHGVYGAVSLTLLATVIAVNPSLVATWVGGASYAGLWTSVGICLSSLAGGWSYLAVSLLRATGEIKPGSWALVLDCLVRLPLMTAFAPLLGLVSLPLAGFVTATIVGMWANARCIRIIGPVPGGSPWLWPTRIAVLTLSILVAAKFRVVGWPQVFVFVSLWTAAVGLALLSSDSRLPRLKKLTARFA